MVGLILHGGAGLDPARDYGIELDQLHAVASQGHDMLLRGSPACDVAVHVVRALEEAGLYIAGRGASPNRDGAYELDAAVMDGRSGAAGAVAALQGFQSPVEVARAVMSGGQHVLLSGAGAASFASEAGFDRVPADWFEPAGLGEQLGPSGSTHGTVGCAVVDAEGHMAAAVSTGGTLGKTPGRIGDSPLVGAGIWADQQIAVVCTGLGEYFIRTAAAARLAHLVEFGGHDVRSASENVLQAVGGLGGAGGIIALDCGGRPIFGRAYAGMKCAAAWPDGKVSSHILWRDRPPVSLGELPSDALVAVDR